MKSEYSLNVATPVNDAVKRVMEMPGARHEEGATLYSKVTPAVVRNQVCLRQLSETQIEFSESFGGLGNLEIFGVCNFDSVSENKTQVTAKFQMGANSIGSLKFILGIIIVLIPVIAWFLYKFLLDSGAPENTALTIPIAASLVLVIVISLEFWHISSKIKFFQKKISDALGVDVEWV